MAYTKEQLLEKYRNLPEDVKTVFDSTEVLDATIAICNKFDLHVDQQGELANEIGLVLLGLSRPANLLSNVQNRLKTSIETAGQIVKEANDKIFFPIRASLEKLNNGGVASYRPEQATKVENFSPEGNVARENIQTPETPLPVPDNNAIITGSTAPIGNAAPSTDSGQAADKKLFDEKMGKLFRLPKEEIELGSNNSNSFDSATKDKTVDPYHEPIS